jgi:hypothetical protein
VPCPDTGFHAGVGGAQRRVEVPAGRLHLQACDIAFPASYVDTLSMIVYDLHCVGGHEFEGWFSDAEDYEQQQAQGMLSCPVCNSADVQRVPTASHIKTQLPTPSADDVPAEAAEKRLSQITLRERHSRKRRARFITEKRRHEIYVAPPATKNTTGCAKRALKCTGCRLPCSIRKS